MTLSDSRSHRWQLGLSRAQAGVSLVEVLVAVVVIAIGLLGLAGLQASGVRVSQSSIHRSQAAQLAYDIVDRMRVNAPTAAVYSIGLNASLPNCDSAPTSSAEVAQCDLRDWRLRLQTLPGGTGAIDTSLAPAVTVTVQWDDSRGGGVLRGSTADDAARGQLTLSQFQITAQLSD